MMVSSRSTPQFFNTPLMKLASLRIQCNILVDKWALVMKYVTNYSVVLFVELTLRGLLMTDSNYIIESNGKDSSWVKVSMHGDNVSRLEELPKKLRMILNSLKNI